MPPRTVAIVDPYSSGTLLAEALIERGLSCIAIESAPSLPASIRARGKPALYADTIRHDRDIETTLARLRPYRPAFVLPGFESGVELAEALAARLDLPTNDPALAQARRDKYLMHEAVARRGLRTARQFRSDDVNAIVDWTRANLDWPVIVKPTRSVGSDHVARCSSVEELRRAAAAVLADVNALGQANTAALVQEFLEGTEYIVDMVTLDGRPKLTAIWQYDRPCDSGEFICYDALRLLPYEGERQAALRDYGQGRGGRGYPLRTVTL